MTKNITVIPSAGGNFHDFTIGAGTTPKEIIEEIQIKEHLTPNENYVLTLGKGADAFHRDEQIYGSVENGQKVYLTTAAHAGI